MRRRVNILCAMLSFGALSGLPLITTSSYSLYSAYAQETHTVESVYSLVISQTPVTESQWNQIPAEDWLRYANDMGGAIIPDAILFYAYSEHPEVFKPEANRIRSILVEEYNVSAAVINNESDLDILWQEYLVYIRTNKENFKELASYYSQLTFATEVSDTFRKYSREEVVEQMKKGDADEFRGVLIRFGGVTEEMLARVPEDAVFNAAVEHRLRNPHGGDWGTALATFKRMYPEAFSLINSPSTDSPIVLSREEVVEQMKNGGEADFKGAIMKYGGVTEEMLARVPEDAVFNAAVEHRMRNPYGGDWGTALATFKRMYPEAFNPNAKPLNDTQRQAKLEKDVQNQQKIMEHIRSTTPDSEYRLLEDNQIFRFDSGTYELKHLFLLHPEEAGNRSTTNYMLGIRYEYTNTTNEEVAVNSEDLVSHSNVSQFFEDSRTILSTDVYELPKEIDNAVQDQALDSIEKMVASVKPGEKVEGTLYFSVPNVEHDLVFSVIQNNQVEEYKLEIETLLKLPPQSVSYVTDGSAPLGYIFDFDKLYLVYESNSDMSHWTSQTGVMIGQKTEKLSKEAKAHYQQFEGSDTVLVELSDIRYKIKDNQIIGSTKDVTKPIIHLLTTTNWQNFQDSQDTTYWKQ